MKIGSRSPGEGIRGNSGKPSPGSGQTNESGHRVQFRAFLEQLAFEPKQKREKSLEESYGDLLEAEEELVNRPGPEQLERYREILGQLLEGILRENTRKITVKQGIYPNIRRNQTIQIVHEKLNDVARILTSQMTDPESGLPVRREAFDLFRRLADIRGLVLELMA